MKSLNFEILKFWPQIVMMMFWTYLYFNEVLKQYRVQIPRRNLKTTLRSTFINSTTLFVLFCGGFFNQMGGVQWFILIFDLFIIIAIWVIYFNKDAFEVKPFVSTKSPLRILISYIILVLIFYIGGFFDEFIKFIHNGL